MARYPTPPGTWGKISRSQVSAGVWRARARYRDETGRIRPMEARGGTGAAAQRELERRLRDLTTAIGEDITPETRIDALATLWIEEFERSSAARPQTVTQYAGVIRRHISPRLGELRIREATPGRLGRALAEIAADSDANGKLARTVLSQMFALAVQRDARSHNPIRDITPTRSAPASEVKALSVEQVHALRAGVRAWVNDPAQRGQKRNPSLPDALDVILGTGLRAGELMALTWADVDLTAERPTVTANATAVHVGGELIRQSAPKTRTSRRVLRVPDFVVEILLRRHVEQVSAADFVFPSATGTMQSPNNFRRVIRSALVSMPEFAGLSPRQLRATVATLVDGALGLQSASGVLGHSSVTVTERHYIGRAKTAPDASAALEVFAQSGE